MPDLPADFAWAAMVPELLVTELAPSLRFWCGLCGFTVAYDRPEDRFAYLDRSGVQVMLEQMLEPGRRWITGPLEPPFGRGINLQITVADVAPILVALDAAGWPLYLAPEVKWYRAGTRETGVRQFLVQDPDGYLLRFSQPLGLRPAGIARRVGGRRRAEQRLIRTVILHGRSDDQPCAAPASAARST